MPEAVEAVEEVAAKLDRAKKLDNILFGEANFEARGANRWFEVWNPVPGENVPDIDLLNYRHKDLLELGRIIVNKQLGAYRGDGSAMTLEEIAQKYPEQEGLTHEEVLQRLEDIKKFMEENGQSRLEEKSKLIDGLRDAIVERKKLEDAQR